jgi:amino acid transporter
MDIDTNAPFSVALGRYFPWASYIVSIGACAGTFNSAFADLYAMSRLMVVLSRCRLIPEFLVRRQQLFSMRCCGLLHSLSTF